jgi:glucose-6-phosphate 1-epimerase
MASNFAIDINRKSEHMHSDQHQEINPAERKLPNDLITLTAADGAQISLSLHGAQVCSWRTADGIERLYLSGLTDWRSTAAIRGGIPLIFPQFASRGPLPKHGFARLSTWILSDSSVRQNGDGFVHLTLRDSAESRLQFPYTFKLDLHVTFSGKRLNTELFVTNTDAQAFDFTCALHTYLSTEIAQSSIRGLSGCRYQNGVADSHLHFDSSGLLHISDEVDSLFFGVQSRVELVTDDAVVKVQQAGFPDVVVWNPWAAGCAKISDLEKDAYQHFVCIESAAIEKPVTLAPGLQWRGHQQLTVCP